MQAQKTDPLSTGSAHSVLEVDVQNLNALNSDDATDVSSVVGGSKGLLKSDTDEQLIIYIPFSQAVNVSKLSILADGNTGPSHVKVFKDMPHLDFSDAEDTPAAADLHFTSDQLVNEDEIKLKMLDFKNIRSITLFIEGNQEDEDVTSLNRIKIIGVQKQGTNMNELKKC